MFKRRFELWLPSPTPTTRLRARIQARKTGSTWGATWRYRETRRFIAPHCKPAALPLPADEDGSFHIALEQANGSFIQIDSKRLLSTRHLALGVIVPLPCGARLPNYNIPPPQHTLERKLSPILCLTLAPVPGGSRDRNPAQKQNFCKYSVSFPVLKIRPDSGLKNGPGFRPHYVVSLRGPESGLDFGTGIRA